MKLSQTELSTGGVFRCCIANFSSSFFPPSSEETTDETPTPDPEVTVGQKLTCPHCKDHLTLQPDAVWRWEPATEPQPA